MQTDCVISECVVECLKVKTSREMEEKFMVLEEMLLAERREGRSEGKAEGKAEEILSFLGERASVPEELAQKIWKETDLAILHKYLQLAVKAESLEQFRKETGL